MEIDVNARQWLLPAQLVRGIAEVALNNLVRLPLIELDIEFLSAVLRFAHDHLESLLDWSPSIPTHSIATNA